MRDKHTALSTIPLYYYTTFCEKMQIYLLGILNKVYGNLLFRIIKQKNRPVGDGSLCLLHAFDRVAFVLEECDNALVAAEMRRAYGEQHLLVAVKQFYGAVCH